MSDIRFNQWLHQSGTGGVSQVASGAVGVGTTNPLADFYVRGDAQITGILTAGHIAMGSSITFGDNDRAYFGDGTDLQVYHSGSHSYVVESGTGALIVNSNELVIKNAADNEDVAKFIQGNASTSGVELYFGNSKKFNTTNTGVVITGICTATSFKGDGSALTGITGTTINNNANNRIITGSGTANTLNGESNFTYDGTIARIIGITSTTNLNVVGVSTFNDTINFNSTSSKRLYLYKDGNDEFSIYNSSGYAYITHKKTGYLLQLQTNHQVKIGSAQSPWRTSATFQPSGSVELYHINDKKFSTTSYGISVHGLTSSSTEGGRIDFTNATTSNFSNNAWARITNDGANGVSQLQFWTQASGGSLTERVRIASSGRIDILGDGGNAGFTLSNAYGQAGFFGGMYYDGSAWVRNAIGTRQGAGIYVNTGGYIGFLFSTETSGTSATMKELVSLGVGHANNGSITINGDATTTVGPMITLQDNVSSGTPYTTIMSTSVGGLIINADAGNNVSGSYIQFKQDNVNKWLMQDNDFKSSLNGVTEPFASLMGSYHSESNHNHDGTVDLTAFTCDKWYILEVFGRVNPNTGGSGAYTDPIHMYIYNGCGYESGVKSFIYCRHVAPPARDAFSSGTSVNGNNVSVVWYDGSSESTSCSASSSSHYVRFKLHGFNTQYGPNFAIRVFKRF